VPSNKRAGAVAQLDYVEIATDVAAAEKKPVLEKPIGELWELSVPTELVRLRQDDDLPTWTLYHKWRTWTEDLKLLGP
jgi:hypothetical protein